MYMYVCIYVCVIDIIDCICTSIQRQHYVKGVCLFVIPYFCTER